MTVAFTGGGTGGHIYPGLAVADSLRAQIQKHFPQTQIKIVWLGSKNGSDKNIVEKNLNENGQKSADVFYGISSGKLRRYFSFRNALDVFKIIKGFFAALIILSKTKPVALFSKGGFVSVPPCVAARFLKIPVYTHECDFTPGLATRINSKFAKNIFVSYAETIKFFPKNIQHKCVVTGNPVRPVFYKADSQKGLDFLKIAKKQKPLLVVVGGSSGAKQINDLVEENFAWLTENFTVVHQTGKVASKKNLSHSDYKSFEFIYNEMPDVLCAADVVLSRAGANSLWECITLKKPLVLVPLCGSGTRGDQKDNAKYFAEKGAAIVLEGENANSQNLQSALSKMLDEATRKSFSDKTAVFAEQEKASEKIAKLLFDTFDFSKNK